MAGTVGTVEAASLPILHLGTVEAASLPILHLGTVEARVTQIP